MIPTSLIVDVSIRVSIVAASVALILFAGRIQSSSLRHAAWTSVLVAMLLMPLAPFVMPAGVAVPIPANALQVMLPVNGETAATLDREPVRVSSPQSTPPAADRGASSSRGIAWSRLVAIVYFVGLMFLLLRVLAGWLAMTRVVRTARKVPDGSFWESPFVTTPVTAGVISPLIVLPVGWRSWPEEKLRAVLVHERAHTRRRDPLVACLARLNCCLFWFHPLAWWLERTLAATAEHACDDEAVEAVGERRCYAEILLDMADLVRRRGGRVAWQGIGVNGNGLLGRRIDRVLRGDIARHASRAGKGFVATGCAAVIVLIVACRPAALQPDPKSAANRAEMKAQQEFFSAARQMTAAQVTEVEADWKRNPEDLTSLHKLLIFYGPDISGKKVPDAERMIEARRPLILWLIEHHPDAKFAAHLQARIFPTSRDWLPDPAGYEAGKKLWLTQASKPDVTPLVLGHAASFLEVADKPLAEQLLLRAAAADPAGQWQERLGSLYGQILVGSQRFTLFNVVNAPDSVAAHSPYAHQIRAKLDASTDAQLLRATGSYLTSSASQAKLDFDHIALGTSYIERAVQLDPDSIQSRALLFHLQNRERFARVSEIKRSLVAGKEPPDVVKTAGSEYQAVSSLADDERFRLLPIFAERALWAGENAEYSRHDAAGAKALWDGARKYSQDALALAEKFRGDPDYGTVIFKANMTLSALAMRDGDKKRSVRYLEAAAAAPASPELMYTGGIASHRPLAYLVKYGEVPAVISYLERMAQINLTEKNALLESAALLRDGKLPGWYLVQIRGTD